MLIVQNGVTQTPQICRNVGCRRYFHKPCFRDRLRVFEGPRAYLAVSVCCRVSLIVLFVL